MATMTSSESSVGEQFPLLDQCLSEESADKLEQYGEKVKSVLGKLRDPLAKAKNTLNTSRFLKSIDRLKVQSRMAKTTVGVVGDTGAGKSSVVNAVLDEETLVPTSCKRACTAVITELSYNYCDDPDALYAAEIHFISRDDWEKELSQLLEDLIDENGDIVRDAGNTASDASIAWVKIKAVYPRQAKEALTRDAASALASTLEVSAILGKKRLVAEATPEAFHKRMRQYIDSDEKEGQKRKKGEKKQLEFWPLIKVVRIFTKAEALSTGVILVDLPGVQDSNAARAAVADNYMKRCDTLWVVAPISRAVDNKTAMGIMSRTLRLQLKLDGKETKVTFVCSKTDDMLFSNTIESLEHDEDMKAYQEGLKQASTEIDTNRQLFDSIQEHLDDIQIKTEEVQERIDWFQELADGFLNNTATNAVIIPQKRRNSTRQSGSRKRTHVKFEDVLSAKQKVLKNETDQDADIKDEADDEESWTEQQIRMELMRLKAEKAHLGSTESQQSEAYDAIVKVLQEAKEKQDTFDAQIKVLCVQDRNKYSSNAIRHEFAQGIKEMDEEAATSANDELFDPEHDVKNYEKIGASLPVFCVSSRAYQQGRGRQIMDQEVQGFPTLDDTGIPQLQAYTKRLTEPDRKISARKLLEDFKELLESLSLWSKDHDGEFQISDDDKQEYAERLQEELSILCEDLNEVADVTVGKCQDILNKYLYAKFDETVKHAARSANEVVEKWFMPKDDGGMPWNTYRAMCIRNGVFDSRSCGSRDLNEELVEPLKQSLANSWERVFASRIPHTLKKFPTEFKKRLENFRKGMQERFYEGTGSGTIPRQQAVLKALVCEHTRRMSAIMAVFRTNMTDLQQTANRQFTPAVTKNMIEAYTSCRLVSGRNSYVQMKAITVHHVNQTRYKMFRKATTEVRDKLAAISQELDHKLRLKINEVITEMTSEYKSIFIGPDLPDCLVKAHVKAAQEARDLMSDTLSQIDDLFEEEDGDDASDVGIKMDDDDMSHS